MVDLSHFEPGGNDDRKLLALNDAGQFLFRAIVSEPGGAFAGGLFVATIPEPGDFDGDGDVDLADYLVMQQGFSGSGVPTPDLRTDLDGDGDNDLTDLILFQSAFTGAS